MVPLNYLLDWSLDERVLNKLKGTGFDTLRDFNQHLCLNLPLINALIRRYDADTRSFILGSAGNPFSVAFGLEDVLFLTGLPIDGKAVTGVDPIDIESVCQRYLGKHLGCGYGRGSSYISLYWLKDNFMTLNDENLSEKELACHVRAYVMYAIGCTFAPSHNLSVSAVFLPLLENVDDIGSYAWGAALLANIHDSIENPTKYSIGFFFPLMIFAYIRFPGLSSMFELDRMAISVFPLLVSWSHALGLIMGQHFNNHNDENLETFFDNLMEEGIGEEEVKWQPYTELSSKFLPRHLRKQVVLSKSRTILICFERAVYHRPDKCQRQLGLAGLVLKGNLIEIKTICRKGRKGRNGKDWSKTGKYPDYISEWDKRFDLLIDRDANATPPDQAKASNHLMELPLEENAAPDQSKSSDHTNWDENVAAEAGSVTDDDACFEKTLDNQDPENEDVVTDILVPGYKELVTVDTEAGLGTRKKSKKRKTCSGGNDSPSSSEDLSCDERAVKVWKTLKQVDLTNKELQQQIITLQSENQVLQAEKHKLEASDSQKDQALTQLHENHLDEVSTLKGQLKQKNETLESTNKELQQQIITLQSENLALQAEKPKLEASDSQKDHTLTQLQKSHLDEVSTLKGQLKQVASTNKELQSNNQALQAEKQKLEASHSHKDHDLTQLQKNHLDEVSTLIGLLKQKDETLDSHLRSAQEATKKVEEMVASLDQERAAHKAALRHAILKYKASPRFAEEFQIVMAPLFPHGYTLGVDDTKAPDLDIGSLANHGQGDETEKRFKELADGQDIVAMYKQRSPAQELDDACSEKSLVLLDNQDPENDSRQFEEEAFRADALFIAELRKENEKLKEEALLADALLIAELRKEIEKLKEEARLADALLVSELRKENEKLKEETKLSRKNIPGHVNMISRLEEFLADSMEENNSLNSRVDNVDVDHQSPAGDTSSSRVRNSSKNRSCHAQIEAITVKKQRVSPSTTTTTTPAGVSIVDRAELPLIIDVDSDSDSDVSITDSFMDALVGRSKKQ